MWNIEGYVLFNDQKKYRVEILKKSYLRTKTKLCEKEIKDETSGSPEKGPSNTRIKKEYQRIPKSREGQFYYQSNK